MVILVDENNIEINIKNLKKDSSFLLTVPFPNEVLDQKLFFEGKGPLALQNIFLLPLD